MLCQVADLDFAMLFLLLCNGIGLWHISIVSRACGESPAVAEQRSIVSKDSLLPVIVVT